MALLRSKGIIRTAADGKIDDYSCRCDPSSVNTLPLDHEVNIYTSNKALHSVCDTYPLFAIDAVGDILSEISSSHCFKVISVSPISIIAFRSKVTIKCTFHKISCLLSACL